VCCTSAGGIAVRNSRIANGLVSFGAALALIFFPIVSRSQAQSAPPPSSGVHLQAELLKPIDAGLVHVGDQVTVRTVTPLEINGQKFPSGATVIGHITQAEPSRLALLFDQVATKKNTPVAMRFSLRAVMMPHPSASQQISPRAECGNCGNGAIPGTDTPRSSGMLRSPEAAAEDSANTVFQGPTPVVKTGNGGVVGLTGVNLSVSDDPKVAAVFESAKGHDLKLDKGLQIMFVVSK
jgi:hypothetical protein